MIALHRIVYISIAAVAFPTAAVIASGGVAVAADVPFQKQSYIGVGLGVANLSPVGSDGEQLGFDQGADRSLSVTLGRDFSKHVSAELQFHDLGADQSDGDDGLVYRDLTLSGIWHVINGYQHRTGFSVFGRLGVGQIEASASSEISRDHEVHLLAGAGIEYGAYSGVALRAEFIYHDDDASQALMGIHYRFGPRSPQSRLPPSLQASVDVNEPEKIGEFKAPESNLQVANEASISSNDSTANGIVRTDLASGDEVKQAVSGSVSLANGSAVEDGASSMELVDNQSAMEEPVIKENRIERSSPAFTETTWIEESFADIESDDDAVQMDDSTAFIGNDIAEAEDSGVKSADFAASQTTWTEEPFVERRDTDARTPGCAVLRLFSTVANQCGLTTAAQQSLTFMINSDTLTQQAKSSLDNVAADLMRVPNAQINIAAHTDNRGNAANNMKLSRGRAIAVASYLLSNGVTREQLSRVRAYGGGVPIADNNTSAGRRSNRRVEITVVSF